MNFPPVVGAHVRDKVRHLLAYTHPHSHTHTHISSAIQRIHPKKRWWLRHDQIVRGERSQCERHVGSWSSSSSSSWSRPIGPSKPHNDQQIKHKYITNPYRARTPKTNKKRPLFRYDFAVAASFRFVLFRAPRVPIQYIILWYGVCVCVCVLSDLARADCLDGASHFPGGWVVDPTHAHTTKKKRTLAQVNRACLQRSACICG